MTYDEACEISSCRGIIGFVVASLFISSLASVVTSQDETRQDLKPRRVVRRWKWLDRWFVGGEGGTALKSNRAHVSVCTPYYHTLGMYGVRTR